MKEAGTAKKLIWSPTIDTFNFLNAKKHDHVELVLFKQENAFNDNMIVVIIPPIAK